MKPRWQLLNLKAMFDNHRGEWGSELSKILLLANMKEKKHLQYTDYW